LTGYERLFKVTADIFYRVQDTIPLQRRTAMSAIHCKIEPNLLTVPETYKIRFIPNNKLMTDDIAAEMCAVAPILTPDVAKTAMSAYRQTIQKNMKNGNHIKKPAYRGPSGSDRGAAALCPA
jgi:hypothetical protein